MKKLYIIALLAINTAFSISAMEEEEIPLGQQLIEAIDKEEIDFNTIESLLSNRANVNDKNYLLRSSLHIAAQRGYGSVAKLLIKHGANVHSTDGLGRTPLHLATYNNQQDIIKLLIEFNAEIDTKDIHNNTPLHTATDMGYVEDVELLTTAPIAFINPIKNNKKLLDKVNAFTSIYVCKMFNLVKELPQPALESIAKSIFTFNNFLEQQSIEKFAKYYLEGSNAYLSQIFFNELYKQHLFKLQLYLPLKNEYEETALDTAKENKREEDVKVFEYLNKIITIKKDTDFEKDLKSKIKKSYVNKLAADKELITY